MISCLGSECSCFASFVLFEGSPISCFGAKHRVNIITEEVRARGSEEHLVMIAAWETGLRFGAQHARVGVINWVIAEPTCGESYS
jgi:hypothetical protein